MARGTPTLNSGTIESSHQNQDILSQLYDTIEAQLTAYQSNGTDAWEAYDVINASSPNKDTVFRSLGDRTLVSGVGDVGLFIRIHQFDSNTLELIGYQDWSTNGSGSGARPNTTSQTRIDVDISEQLKWWSIVNEYEFGFFWAQAGSHQGIWFGSPDRTHIPSNANGVAKCTLSHSSGTSIVIPLDRDISANITSQGDVATETLTLAGQPNDGDQVLIDAKTYTFQTTLTNVDGNVHIGATASDTIDNLIGAITLQSGTPGTDYATATTIHPTAYAEAGAGDTMDASAKNGGTAGNSIATTDPTDTSGNLSWGAATMSGGTDNAEAQKIWVYNQTATGDVLEGSTVQILDVLAITATRITLSLSSAIAAGALIGMDPSPMGQCVMTNTADPTIYMTNASDGTYTIAQNVADFEPLGVLYGAGTSQRPGPNSLYQGSKALFVADQSAKQGPRGTVQVLGFFPFGNQASRDLMNPDFNSAQAYKIFTYMLNNSHALGIGPGAT